MVRNMNPFDFIDDLSFKKQHLLSKDVNGELKKEFDSFLTIRHFSYFPETIFYSNEMNTCGNLNKEDIYDFFFYIIPAKKRFTKWPKRVADTQIEMIQEYYNYSRKKALEVQPLLNEDNMKYIAKKLDKGGAKK